jgi:hypothetical protein
MKNNETNLQLIGLQAMLPGLEMALQLLNEQVNTILRLVQRQHAPAPQPEPAPLPAIQAPAVTRVKKDGRRHTPPSDKEQWRKNVSDASKAYYASLTPAQRKARAAKLLASRLKGKRRPTSKPSNTSKPRGTSKATPNLEYLLQWMRDHGGTMKVAELRHVKHPAGQFPNAYYNAAVYADLKTLSERGQVRKIGAGKYELVAAA